MAPFMKRDSEGSSRVNWIRIIEGVIIGLIPTAVIGLLGFLWMIPDIKREVKSINENIIEIKNVTSNHEGRIRDAELRIAAHTGRSNGRH